MEDIALTPFAHTQGLYFNPEPEYQNREFDIINELDNRMKEDGYLTVDVGEENNAVSYYDAKYKTMKNMYDGFKVEKCEAPGMLVIEIDEDNRREML